MPTPPSRRDVMARLAALAAVPAVARAADAPAPPAPEASSAMPGAEDLAAAERFLLVQYTPEERAQAI